MTGTKHLIFCLDKITLDKKEKKKRQLRYHKIQRQDTLYPY